MAGYGNFIPSQFHQEKSSLEAAAEAAAKVNAMLIAKGKLRPNQIHNNQNQKKVNPSSMVAAEVEINDAPGSMRNMLTRGPTQEEITKFSGAAVSTRGRFMTPLEKKMNNGSERPLYLFVQGPSQDSVNVAVARINEILTGGKGAGGGGGGLVRTSAIGPPVPQTPQLNMPPPHHHHHPHQHPHQPPPHHQGPPLLPVPTLDMPPVHQPPPMLAGPPMQPPPEMQQITVLEEKLFIGLEHAPPNFDVKGKLLGPGGSYLMHIETETGAKVMLRGKGSGFIEPALGREPFEPMHIIIQHPAMMGMQQAKQLAENLIQTVQQMYATFQQALAALPPALAQPGPAAYISGLQQPSSLGDAALLGPPPGLPTLTGLQEAQLVPSAQALQPQQTMIVPSSSMSSMMMPAGSMATSMPTINPGQPGAPVLLNTPLSMAPMPVMTTLPISSQPPLQLQPPPTALDLGGGQQLLVNQAGGPHQLAMTLAPQMSMSGVPTSVSVPVSMTSLASLGPSQLPPQAPIQPPPTVQLVSQPPNPVAPPPSVLGGPPVSVMSSMSGLQQQQAQAFQTLYNPDVVSSVLTPGMSSPLVVSSTPTSHIYSLATSTTLVSHPGPGGPGSLKDPGEAPRRRFTEEKDDKIPDSLLGYQHGPPHLVNLVCSSPPPGQAQHPHQHPHHPSHHPAGPQPTLMQGPPHQPGPPPPGQPQAPQPGMPHPHQHPQLTAQQPQTITLLPAQAQPGVELQPGHPGMTGAPSSYAVPHTITVQTIHALPQSLHPPPSSLSPVSQAYHLPPSSMADDSRYGVVVSSAGGMMPPPPPPGSMGMSPSGNGDQGGPRQLMPPPHRHDQPWGGPANGHKRPGEDGGEPDNRKRRKAENGFEDNNDDNGSNGSGQSPTNTTTNSNTNSNTNQQSESPPKADTPTSSSSHNAGTPRPPGSHSPPPGQGRGGGPQDSNNSQDRPPQNQDSPFDPQQQQGQNGPHPPPPPPPPNYHHHHYQHQQQQGAQQGQFEGGAVTLGPPQPLMHPHHHQHPAPPHQHMNGGGSHPHHHQYVEAGGGNPQQPPPPPLHYQEMGQPQFAAPGGPAELSPFHPQHPHQGPPREELAPPQHHHHFPPHHPQGAEMGHPGAATYMQQGEMTSHAAAVAVSSHQPHHTSPYPPPPPFSQAFTQPQPQATHFITTGSSSPASFLAQPAPPPHHHTHFISHQHPHHHQQAVRHPHQHHQPGPPPPPPPPPPTSQYQQGPQGGYWQ